MSPNLKRVLEIQALALLAALLCILHESAQADALAASRPWPGARHHEAVAPGDAASPCRLPQAAMVALKARASRRLALVAS